MSDVVRVAVNADVCIGSGQCEMLEEDTFLIDDDTVIAGVVGEGMLPRDRALRVVETCPTGAISIVDPTDDPPQPEEEAVLGRVEERPGDGSRPAGGEV